MMNSIITRFMAEVVRQCCFGKNSQTNEETPTEMESVIRKFQQTRASLRWWDMVLVRWARGCANRLSRSGRLVVVPMLRL